MPGFAALVAPGVRNTGTITATLGTVALASGNGFTLDFYGDRLITLGVGDQIAAQVRDVATGQPLKSLVSNEGKLRANGGRVELTAATARQVVDSVINNTGVIEANTFRQRGGTIVLSAGDRHRQDRGRAAADRAGRRHAFGVRQEEGQGRQDRRHGREHRGRGRAHRRVGPAGRRHGADRRRLVGRQSEHRPRLERLGAP